MAEPKANKAVAGRREFLKLMGIGGLATAAATAGRAPEAKEAPPEVRSKAGYRETEHVKRFYKLARF